MISIGSVHNVDGSLGGIAHSVLTTQRVGKIVEQNYMISVETCTSLAFGVNDVYEIRSSSDRYVIRISAANRYLPYDQESYQQEVKILLDLEKQGFHAAEPLPLITGEYVGSLLLPEGTRYFILFAFIPGKTLSPMDETNASLLGEMLAKLHLCFDQINLENVRFGLNEELIIHKPLRLYSLYPNHKELDEIREIAKPLTSKINDNRDNMTLGLIHGDFQGKNIISNNGKMVLIDFDMVSQSFQIFDIAIQFSALKFFHNDTNIETRSDFITGYNSVKPLTDVEIEMIPYFEICRAFLAIGENIVQSQRFGERQSYKTVYHICQLIIKWWDALQD